MMDAKVRLLFLKEEIKRVFVKKVYLSLFRLRKIVLMLSIRYANGNR